MSGWIKLHRKFLTWEWIEDSNMVSLFIYLLLRANHESNNWKGVGVERGQVIFGRKQASKTLGISEKSIRTCMIRLKSANQLAIKTTNKFSLVTIVNFDEYQESTEETASKTASKRANERPANGQQTATLKEYKEVKKESTSGRARLYVDFVNLTFKRKYHCTTKVIGNFTARIKDYPPEVLKQVVDNVKASKFHQDSNFSYADPAFLLRTSTIEKYKHGPIVHNPSNNHTPEPKSGQKYNEETNLYTEFQ